MSGLAGSWSEFVVGALWTHWLLGAALVAIVALVLARSQRLNAATRHTILLLTLFALLALPVGMFFEDLPLVGWLASGEALPVSGERMSNDTKSRGAVPGEPFLRSVRADRSPTPESGWSDRQSVVRPFLEAATLGLAALWLLLGCFHLGNLLRAALEVGRLRQTSEAATSDTVEQVAGLARRSGLAESPRVRVHSELDSPACIGLGEPTILLPRDWPSGLSDSSARHALLHELAHVARRDAWLGLAQGLVQAALALSPPAWWLRRQIELERESACDDWARLQSGVDAPTYGEGLLECLEQALSLPTSHVAAGPENPLVASWLRSTGSLRRRLLLMTDSKRDHHPDVRPLPVLILAVLLATAILAAAALWPGVPAPAEAASPVASESASVETRWQGDYERLNADDAPLFSAIRRGRVNLVRALLQEGEPANQIWPGDGSPLIVAAREGSLEIVQLLLDEGADVDLGVGGDGTPLIQAAENGHREIVDLLLSYGADIDAHGEGGDGNPLIQASLSGQLELADHLIQRGATIDIHIEDDDTPLVNAAQGGHLDVVRLLLERGADPNLEGDWDSELKAMRTPLNQARKRGHDRVVELLLARGADS